MAARDARPTIGERQWSTWSFPRETDSVVDAARRLFSGRDGRIALTLLLAVTAAIEANIYTPENPEFPFEDGGGDPAAAVLLNVFVVLPLLAANRFPVIAAAATSFLSLVILASPETAVTLSALGVLLYTVGHLVARRGLLLCEPVVFLFFVHAVIPLDGGGWISRASVRSCWSSRLRSPASRVASARKR